MVARSENNAARPYQKSGRARSRGITPRDLQKNHPKGPPAEVGNGGLVGGAAGAYYVKAPPHDLQSPSLVRPLHTARRTGKTTNLRATCRAT